MILFSFYRIQVLDNEGLFHDCEEEGMYQLFLYIIFFCTTNIQKKNTVDEMVNTHCACSVFFS